MSTGDISRDDSFGSSNSPRFLRSDSSFEIIDDSLRMAHNSLTPLRTSVVNPLQGAVEQNKELKKLLEECEKKMTSIREDQDTMLQNLDKEKKKCNALEEETVRLQVDITSLHQKLAEVSKQRDDAIKDLLPSSPVKKAVTNDLDFSVENNKERIKIDAMRQSKMEMLAKNLVETKQQLEECQKHLKSKDNDLVAAHKKTEAMRCQMTWLEETLAEERAKKIEKENELNTTKRTVAQLNMKLGQEASSYDEATRLLNDTHNEELNNIRADYNKKMANLQQMNSKLQQQVDTLKQDFSTKDKERQDMTLALEAVHKKEIEDLTNTNMNLNRELGTLKMSVQDKETTLSQLERERNSLKETVELMRQQIQSYGGDFDVERQSREQITIENAKLTQKVKDMELQFQRIREDYTTERTTRDLVASENKRLKQELNECKTEHAVEKTQLLQQIEVLKQKQGSNFPPAQQGSHFPPAQQGGHFPSAQQGGHGPPAQQGGHFPSAQQGGHGPPAQQGGHFPSAQQGGHGPPAQQGGHFPSAQQGGHGPPAQQGGHFPSAQQGGHGPPAQQGGHFPSAQQGGHGPPAQQGGHFPSAQQGGHGPPAQQGGHFPSAQQGGHGPPAQQGGHFPSAQQGGHGPPAQQGGHFPSAQQGGHGPPAQQGSHFPSAQQGSHFPSAQQGSHFPSAQQGGHFPPAQQGGHGPPLQQESGHIPLPQQGISQSGIPTNASNDILRAHSNAYIPPPQRPIPPEHRRQVDDATVPVDGPRDSADIRYPPKINAFICPICQRSDFDSYETLHLHAAYCGVH